MKKLRNYSLIIFILVIWQIFSNMGLISRFLLPSPFEVFRAFIKDFKLIIYHTRFTLEIAFIGIIIGILLSIILSLIMDRFDKLYDLIYPLLVLTQTIPTIAIAPLLIIWLGYYMKPKIVLVVISTFFPITISLLNGYRSVDEDNINLLKAMGANKYQIYRYLKIPSSMPYFFSGLKVSMSYALISAVVAEWLGGYYGLGVYMTRVRKAYALDRMFSIIFFISMLSLILMLIIDKIEKKSNKILGGKKMKKMITIITTLFLLVISCGEQNKVTEKNLKDITFVLDWTPNTNHTGIYVAKDKGIFEKYGLNVNIVQPSEDSSSSIVGSGRAEFGVYFQPNMIGKLKRGMPIKAIAAIMQHNTAGLMTLKSFNTNSPKDLENLKYASWEDPIDDATVKDIVGKNIKRVPYGDITDPLAAMEHGLFDYLISYYAWDGINAKIKDVAINFYFFKDYNKNLDYYTPVIISNDEFLKENPEITKNFLKAAREGYEFAIKNPEEAAKILIKNAPESSPELIMESQKWISKQYKGNMEIWGVFDIERWDNFYNWLYENKLVDKKLPSSYGVTNEYIKD